MKKSLKGALAATAGGVLLLGGAGSLAFWSDGDTVNGTDIASGHMVIDPVSCGQGWTLDGGAEFVDQTLVPGDSLTQDCTFEVHTSGEHLQADLTVDSPALSGAVDGSDQPLLDELDLTVDWKQTPDGGSPVDIDPATEAVTLSDGDKIAVAMKIDWPYGDPDVDSADNDSNVLGGLAAALADTNITVAQSHVVSTTPSP